ncbi:hypothetical protein [Actinomadura napierensis]|uniref:hypothetical protein n=1 Tax=Actinomadura napierensis TaxID=267854 RepID=UPI0031CED3AE
MIRAEWVPVLTGLSVRQVALLFEMSESAAHRVVDHLALLLALTLITLPTQPRHGAERGRHAGARPRPDGHRLVQELQALAEHAGGH